MVRPGPHRTVAGWWLAAVLTAAAGCDRLGGDPGHAKVVIDGREFTVELALDEPSRVNGLKGVEDVPDDGGMLFVFPDSQVRGFWMERCLVDIDIVFADSMGRVTAVQRMKREPPRGPDETQAAYEARLPRYSSHYPARFAVELRAGWLDRLSVPVDSRIEMDLDRLKALAR